MEKQVQRLVEKTWEKYQHMPPSQRLLIAVSGVPGSGKTTLAKTVCARLNALHLSSSDEAPLDPIAVAVPLDGYHLTRAQLSAMPNPATAHARRGAAFTFDGRAFLTLVTLLREYVRPSTPTIYAPSFDHARKDPVAADIAIPPSTRIVVFEGNYLSLARPPWSDAAALMDDLWFVDVDFVVARRRLVARHVRTGIAADEAAADRRVTENDLVNGAEILSERLPDVHVVTSHEDEAWKAEGEA
ncbi:MAG: hypothetical protein M1832_005608 [Thelocarpon impressellum]|nr:MAG: hypothetical protein M1832_005608 [Thelocarpon impressellum]